MCRGRGQIVCRICRADIIADDGDRMMSGTDFDPMLVRVIKAERACMQMMTIGMSM